VTRNCNDGDPCTADSCVPATGCTTTPIQCNNCRRTPPVVCAPIACKINECDPADGQCKSRDIDCNDNNLCSVDSCDTATGKCAYTQMSCDDNDACTHDYCDPITGCKHLAFNVSIDCNDNSVCTTDTCDPAVGCVWTNITCSDGKLCTTDDCNSILGCEYPVKDCGKDEKVKQFIGDCYIALCAQERDGCYLEQIPGTKVDECQVCNGDGSTCLFGLSTGQAIGISAGLLAVIIIAAVVVCAALGIFGGKKGYDIWLNHKNNMQGANTNPLYNDRGLTGTNPLYADKS